MKKAVSIFMLFVLLLGVLSACGPDREATRPADTGKDKETKTEEPAKPEKLVVWEDTDKGIALEPAIASFEEKYGITVEFQELGMADKIRDQLRLDGPAGNAPDVVTLPHDQIGQVAIEGLIQEIKVDQSVIDTFTESSITAQMFDGKLYGLPKATETPVFIYNKALMESAPKTMDEVYEFAKNFNQEGKYGFIAVWDDFYFAHGVLAGMGGYVFKEKDGSLDPANIGLNNDGAIKGAEYIQKWYSEGLFPNGIIGQSGGTTRDGLFNEGSIASMMNGPWAFQGAKDAGIDIGVAPMPKLPNGKNMKTFMGVKGWHVTAFTDNAYWATKFVEHITNEENAKKRYELTQEIPPVKSLIDDPVIAENEGAKAVAEQSQYAVPMPNIPHIAEVWEPMASALQTIATGKSEAKPALDDAVKTIETNIESNHPTK
ncbi:cyclodextrin-binding protein [Bacillus canaveralius]|uniref:Cyclodextrin-binding protein n=1 Tax=Bacillus canaveralius TaxID=1403243 RepID=A0A2N5GKJ2_9BACI|nr:extracellular solute-binding protein [Bacillus canaveralius]PLR81978.1 cyclodextrin-binding protein [Bacillus canaveralius]PLR99364.1 cyclodextrin-binding protein [Bacillus canaveralius]